LTKLTFEPPDPERFPALRITREVLQAGGRAPTILNAANEIAVENFLAGKIGFLEIAAAVEETLSRVPNGSLTSLEDVYTTDIEARAAAREAVDKFS